MKREAFGVLHRVNLLYANVLRRVADKEGSDYWLGQMQGGIEYVVV
nr:DUF4214 domain-containing protein [Rhodoferax sp.]